jgi:hypothetical protein
MPAAFFHYIITALLGISPQLLSPVLLAKQRVGEKQDQRDNQTVNGQ